MQAYVCIVAQRERRSGVITLILDNVELNSCDAEASAGVHCLHVLALAVRIYSAAV